MLFNSDRSSRNINVCLYIHISLCQVCLDLSFLISLTRLSLLEHISLVKHAQLREHCTTDQHGWIGDLRSQTLQIHFFHLESEATEGNTSESYQGWQNALKYFLASFQTAILAQSALPLALGCCLAGLLSAAHFQCSGE